MELMEDASAVERMLLRQAAQTQTPISGSLELLPLCNMDCDMCYVRLSREEMERRGRLRTAEEWLEIGHQMQKSGVLFLLLTGGEPLLYPDFRDLYLELKKMGMILTVNTNGTLIDEEWAAFFGKNRPRRINVTLYGGDDTAYETLCHYPEGFARAERGIHLLKEQGVDVKINGSLAGANQGEMEKIFSLGDAWGVPVRFDTYMVPATRERERPYSQEARLAPEEAAAARIHALKREMGSELFREFAVQVLQKVDREPGEVVSGRPACNAGKCSFTINWQGKMRPCVVMTEPTADVFALGFSGAWDRIREQMGQIRLSAACSACNLKSLCRSCAASAFLETGSYEGTPEYLCRYAKSSLEWIRKENLETKQSSR